MERVGLPVFESRISPVLDSCNRLLVVDIQNGREVNRTEISLEKTSITERIEVFTRWGIHKIICAGVSDVMCRYLAARNIALVSGIAGNSEEILNAYICDKLDDACYIMPGKGRDRRRSKQGDHNLR
jgi:predicted Fe-Mo cluster-binding NifX family protein